MDEAFRKKSLYIGMTLSLLFVGILLGVLITSNPGNSQSVRTDASETKVGDVEIITPQPGAKIDSGEIKARFKTKTGIDKLGAVYKIDDTPAQKMAIERISEEITILTGLMDTKLIAPGKHTMSVYVYSNQDAENRLIGSAVFYFNN